MTLLTRTWTLLVTAVGMWLERNAFVHAGSLAFYTLFSLAPVVIIAISVAGAVFGEEAARGEIVALLDEFLGRDVAAAVEDAVARSRPEVAGTLPAISGVIAMIVGATTVFAQMQLSLNRMWGVAAKPSKSGIVLMILNRVVSLTLVLALGFILLVSLLLNMALRAAFDYSGHWISIPPVVLGGAELLVSFGIVTVLFAVIFKVLPDVRLDWPDVWFGAAATAALFLAGRTLIALYLTYTAPDSAYGAAGSLVLTLLWVYYSSLILFFGAALTKAHVLAANRPIRPTPLAVLMKEVVVEEGEAPKVIG